MRRYLLLTSAVAVLMGCLSSCSSEEESLPIPETNSVTFSIGINAQTRAAQPLDVNAYDAKMYLFEGEEADDGTLSYSYKNEVEITTNVLTIGGLTEGKKYKAVFLARPESQTPALPTFSTTNPSYKEAIAQYISDNETDKDIFRSIVSFALSSDMGTQSTVLTRQNGALEVRIQNMTDMASVKLHIKGHKEMLLHDGTGGEVITNGDGVELSKTMTDGLSEPEVRIRIKLLPQENIKDESGTDNYLEITYNDGETKKYPIDSDHWRIPIFPNQVTWLTLKGKTNNGDGGDDGGDDDDGDDDNDKFEVGFDDGIDLKEKWDGWYEGF